MVSLWKIPDLIWPITNHEEEMIDERGSDGLCNMENIDIVPRHTGGSVALPSAMQDPLS